MSALIRVDCHHQESYMKKLIIIAMTSIIGVAAWAQTTLEFITREGAFVPLFEVTGQMTMEGSSGSTLVPLLMAPGEIEISNGWHRFQAGESSLYKRFDVLADGTVQKWELSAARPGARAWAIAMSSVGVLSVSTTATLMLFDALGSAYNPPHFDLVKLAVLVGGVATIVGGRVLANAAHPTATRLQ
jgi:hypothetical protein